MSIRNLEHLFQPGSVAVIGASDRPQSIGATVMRNLLEGGFAGPIWPVNPKHSSVAGRPAFRDVASLPQPPDLAVICTPAPTVPGIIAELGRCGTRAAVVITAGLSAATAPGEPSLRQAMLDAAKERLRLWDISDEQIKKIETTGKPIRTLTIYSPVSGYVLQKMAVQGMRVMPGEKLFDVVDLSSVWVVSDIYEYELPLIKVGQTARISLSYFPGKEFSTRVDYVYPALAGETRTAKVRFTIPNPDGVLKPQMFTNVEIKINLGNRLTVPAEAVIDTGVRQIVYVDKGEGYFEPREVTTGLKVDELVEVTGGIKAGEKVASSANFLIDSEAQLKGVTALKRKK